MHSFTGIFSSWLIPPLFYGIIGIRMPYTMWGVYVLQHSVFENLHLYCFIYLWMLLEPIINEWKQVFNKTAITFIFPYHYGFIRKVLVFICLFLWLQLKILPLFILLINQPYPIFFFIYLTMLFHFLITTSFLNYIGTKYATWWCICVIRLYINVEKRISNMILFCHGVLLCYQFSNFSNLIHYIPYFNRST